LLEVIEVWHEISNSLTAVNLTLEFLQQNCQYISLSELNEELGFSLQSLDHVKHVMLLASSFAVTSESNKVNVVVVARQVSSTLQRKWPNFELQLVNKIGNLEVSGLKTPLTQVLMNLVSNAIESYERKPLDGKLKVKITLKKGENDCVQIIIQDWGKGISTQTQKQMFKEFFTTRKKVGGTGIGLAMCKKIVEQEFNGKIRVKSRVGKGSVFQIELPKHV